MDPHLSRQRLNNSRLTNSAGFVGQNLTDCQATDRTIEESARGSLIQELLGSLVGPFLSSGTQDIAHNQNQAPSSINATAVQEELQVPLEALGYRWQVFLVLVYSLTAITSFVLNVITVIVLSRYRRSELRKYLINLSLSDLVMSLFSIQYMLGRWIFAPFLCPVVRFMVTLSVFVSAATMTVIGINRHLAIMYPFRRKKCPKFRKWTLRKTYVIAAIWLVGVAISVPEYLMFALQPFCHNNTLHWDCRQLWPDSNANSYTVFIYLCTFAVPLSLLTYLYARIGLKLWRRRTPGNVDVNRDLTMHAKRVKVIKMLFVVVILFVVSWLPMQTLSLLMFLYPESRGHFGYQTLEYNIFVGTCFACHWLSMAHSCINPLIYCFMNDKFRSDLHELVCRRRGNRRPATSNQASHSQLGLSQFGSLHTGASLERLQLTANRAPSKARPPRGQQLGVHV